MSNKTHVNFMNNPPKIILKIYYKRKNKILDLFLYARS